MKDPAVNIIDRSCQFSTIPVPMDGRIPLSISSTITLNGTITRRFAVSISSTNHVNPKKDPAVNIIDQKDPTVKIIDRYRELRTCADGWKDPAVNIIDHHVEWHNN